jgi:hypothetical protein
MRLRRILLGLLGGWLGLAGLVLRAQDIPWVLPWNDASPGATDFSNLNSPTGHERVAVDAAGHFAVDGKRIRFLGVNFAGDSPFTPTNNADAVAARLAKFGINSVRFHHMDAPWAVGGGMLAYTATTSTNINAANLERVHFLISRLKAHGVFADINLLVGREYRSADGLGREAADMDQKTAHILGYFYEPALALQKDYATQVLTPVNRFTGLSLALDPEVAFVEIINENGIIQKWLDGGLDKMPERYAQVLQSRWNGWLAERYGGEAAMLLKWKVIAEPLGGNLLDNGDFGKGLAGWNGEQHDNARAQFERTDDFTGDRPAAKVTVTKAGTESWFVQLNHPGIKLLPSTVYTMSFWAKARAPAKLAVSMMMAHDPWSNLGVSEEASASSQWKQFAYTFQTEAGDDNARFNFGGMGGKPGTFWFADARLQQGGQIGALPAGASLAAKTVPIVRQAGGGYAGTTGARRDWLAFLRDLEYGYFDAMKGHLRTNIGYPGLIFGTILANSPATVQARLDVIDSHAYWQHPEFPGRPWDSSNWRVPNISMVNTLDDKNTIEGLARQRIRGKPFVVTEYQHPSPNYYGAEGPLMLAAYAGLQDWDGLWLFDYGPGSDMAPMGHVGGYFEIAQHPTKMANMLLAANLFRRGDVRPARSEYTAELTPEKELDLLENASAWSVFNSRQLGVPGKLALVSRVNTSVLPKLDGLNPAFPTRDGDALISDSSELVWDVSEVNRGQFIFNTSQTKGVAGFRQGRANLGGVILETGPTRLGWCTWGITLRRGQSFTNDCSALIVATGWWENTGQVWSNEKKESVGNHWGHAPVLTEVVPFTLTLPVASSRVHVWSLDPRGQRMAELPVTGNALSATLDVKTNAGSIWYEVEVAK